MRGILSPLYCIIKLRGHGTEWENTGRAQDSLRCGDRAESPGETKASSILGTKYHRGESCAEKASQSSV